MQLLLHLHTLSILNQCQHIGRNDKVLIFLFLATATEDGYISSSDDEILSTETNRKSSSSVESDSIKEDSEIEKSKNAGQVVGKAADLSESADRKRKEMSERTDEEDRKAKRLRCETNLYRALTCSEVIKQPQKKPMTATARIMEAVRQQQMIKSKSSDPKMLIHTNSTDPKVMTHSKPSDPKTIYSKFTDPKTMIHSQGTTSSNYVMAFNTSQATNDQSSLSKKNDSEISNQENPSSNMKAKNLRFSTGASYKNVEALSHG